MPTRMVGTAGRRCLSGTEHTGEKGRRPLSPCEDRGLRGRVRAQRDRVVGGSSKAPASQWVAGRQRRRWSVAGQPKVAMPTAGLVGVRAIVEVGPPLFVRVPRPGF